MRPHKEKTAWLPNRPTRSRSRGPICRRLEQFNEVVADVFATRMLSNFAKYTQLLESRAATVLDHPAPQSVSSCDIGLVLAWRALECTAGEVIVPSFTFCSTVNALSWNGLEPVFADVDPETYCLDPEDVRRRITPRTVGIAAVHTFGLPADIAALEGLAQRARPEARLRRGPRAGRAVSGTALWVPSAMPRSSASAGRSC